jgi:hypothetical protein
MKPIILGYFTPLCILNGLSTDKVQPTVDKSAQNGLPSGNCAKVYQFITQKSIPNLEQQKIDYINKIK